ncbi:MAG: ABC transporter permease [Blastocatellia bacterium]
MWQELRFAGRSLRKRPGLTLIILLTLSLGIGANTAIFTVVNAVLLAPLPYGAPERLVTLWSRNDKKQLTQNPVSYINYQDWCEQAQSFEQIAAIRPASFTLLERGEASFMNGVRVTSNMLATLGVTPVAGRDFRTEEGVPGKASVALISYGLWQRRYAASAQVIGQSLLLDGRPYTIIGVLPAWLKYPGLQLPPTGAEVWIPFVPEGAETQRSFANVRIVGKLKPGITLTQAQAEMTGIAARLEQQYPNDNANVGVDVFPLREFLIGRVQNALWILFGAVGFVLLIACANVANLLLARAAGRQVETAIRIALGAGRWHVMRQFLLECLLLSLSGSALGTLLAYQGIALLKRTNAGNIPRLEEITVNGRVLGFTLLVSCVTACLFGLLPAVQSTRTPLIATLKEGRKGAAGSWLNRRLLNSLVVAEIALALVLLVGAGLLIRSFRAITEVKLGFDPQNVLTMSVPLPQATYPDQAKQAQYFQTALARLQRVAGVQEAAMIFRVPLVGLATASFTLQGQLVPPGSEPNADYRAISGNYFRAVGIPLLQGREFNEHDTAESADAIIINQELATRHWPNENPLGKRLQLAQERTRFREVVGVVGNAKLTGIDAQVDPAIYVPLQQNTWSNALRNSYLVVRTQTDPRSLAPTLQQELRAVDPAIAITQVRTLPEIVAESLAQRRFNMVLLLVFAAVAGVLAIVGIYGVMSYSVAQRTNEIGVRLALGAQPADILKLILGDGAKMALLGVVLGLAGAFALTRLMAGLLFGVSALDPLVFLMIGVLLTLTALAATYLPARRATKVSPVSALKYD